MYHSWVYLRSYSSFHNLLRILVSTQSRTYRQMVHIARIKVLHRSAQLITERNNDLVNIWITMVLDASALIIQLWHTYTQTETAIWFVSLDAYALLSNSCSLKNVQIDKNHTAKALSVNCKYTEATKTLFFLFW